MHALVPANDVSLSPGTWPAMATLAPSSSMMDLGGSRGMPGERAAFALSAETAGDVAPRDLLLDRAMAPNWRRKSSEKIRKGRAPALAFVARDDSGAVVGTVRLWSVSAGEGGREALLLGPLAVDPALRSAGIGGALMRHAIVEAQRAGHAAILLVGDPAYYARFGFSAEKTGCLAMPGPFEKHRLLAVELKPGALGSCAGVIRPTGRKVERAA